jgi:hypothetical protein
MNTERGGPGGRLRMNRVSTLKSANFWYHREMAEGAMGGEGVLSGSSLWVAT